MKQAEVLRLGGADVRLQFLELMEVQLEPSGALSLGMSLSFGNNLSLLSLKLDHNRSLGSEGVYFILTLSDRLD